MEDFTELLRRQALFQKAVLETKRDTYTHFVENLSCKQDGLQDCKFLAILNNRDIQHKNETIFLIRNK
jgi:hypothetical protein